MFKFNLFSPEFALSMSSTTAEAITADLTGGLENLVITGEKDKFKPEKVSKKQKKKRFDEKDEKKCRQLFVDMNSAKTRSKIRASCQSLHDQYTKNPFDYESFKTVYAAFIVGNLKTEPEKSVEPVNIIKPTNFFKKEFDAFAFLKMNEMKLQARINRFDRMKREAQRKMSDSFGPSRLLYVRVLVNGEPTIAIVDSGSTTSMIGLSFAKKANLDHAIDRRFHSVFIGEGGTDKLVGRIHSCVIKIGSISMKANLKVIIHAFDILIGLDILRNFRGCIDLQYERLTIKDMQTFTVHSKFLSFDEIKQWYQENEERLLREKKVDKEKLSELIEMGYDKKDAEKTLTDCANDLPDAVCHLYKHTLINCKLNEQNGRKGEENGDATETELKNVHIMPDNFHSDKVTATNDQHESALVSDNDMENRCRQLFNEMSNPMLKLKIFVNWRPLHDVYINNRSDYESFKWEYSKLVIAQKQTQEIINDSTSAVGKALNLWKSKSDNWNELREESANKKSVHPNIHIFIRVVINGTSTIAVVDSGSTRCSISMTFAKKAGLVDMIDHRDRPTFNGFGGKSQKAGMIHLCSIKIGHTAFYAKLYVENSYYYDLLIGLDFLLRHNCVIDLEGNRLIINERIHAEFVSEDEASEWRKGCEMPVHHKFKVDEVKLKELAEMGFKKKDAEKALKVASNNLNLAVRYLYYKANEEFVKNSNTQKKEIDFAEILNPMGLLLESDAT